LKLVFTDLDNLIINDSDTLIQVLFQKLRLEPFKRGLFALKSAVELGRLGQGQLPLPGAEKLYRHDHSYWMAFVFDKDGAFDD